MAGGRAGEGVVVDKGIFPTGSLVRQLRVYAGDEDKWKIIVSLIMTIAPALSGRMNEAIIAMGLPPAAAEPGDLTEDQINSVIGFFHLAGTDLTKLTAINERTKFVSKQLFSIVFLPAIRLQVVSYVRAHVDSYVPPLPKAGGGGGGIDAAAVAGAAATAVASSKAGEKQTVQTAADGTWPEIDVLAAVTDASFAKVQAAIQAQDPTDISKLLTGKVNGYTTLSSGAQLLLWAIISQQPVLKMLDPKNYKNSEERKELNTVAGGAALLLGVPARSDFCTRTQGTRPPSHNDHRRSWQAAIQLHPAAWGKDLHHFAAAEEVRSGSVGSIFSWYMGWESAIQGLLSQLAFAVPALVQMPDDHNVLMQHAREVINGKSYAAAFTLAERKEMFHTNAVAPLLDTMRANLVTTLETASASASHGTVNAKHQVVTLKALLDPPTGKDICPAVHEFIKNPMQALASRKTGAAAGAGFPQAAADPGAKRALTLEGDQRARSIAEAAERARIAISPAPLAGLQTPKADKRPRADGTEEPEQRVEKKAKVKVGDVGDFYDLYTLEGKKILQQKFPNQGDLDIECPKQAYLKTGYCAGPGRCAGSRSFVHIRQAGATRIMRHRLSNGELALIMDMYIDRYDHLPANFPRDKIRPNVASRIKACRGG